MRIVFVPISADRRKLMKGGDSLLMYAELHFDDSNGDLAGFKLEGFAVRQKDDEVFVTLPARAVGGGVHRQYYPFLRAQNGDSDAVTQLKARILHEYKRNAERERTSGTLVG